MSTPAVCATRSHPSGVRSSARKSASATASPRPCSSAQHVALAASRACSWKRERDVLAHDAHAGRSSAPPARGPPAADDRRGTRSRRTPRWWPPRCAAREDDLGHRSATTGGRRRRHGPGEPPPEGQRRRRAHHRPSRARVATAGRSGVGPTSRRSDQRHEPRHERAAIYREAEQAPRPQHRSPGCPRRSPRERRPSPRRARAPDAAARASPPSESPSITVKYPTPRSGRGMPSG
jgi:hypothetical protein